MAIGRLFRHLTYQVFAPGALVRSKYNAFRELLRVDEACHRFIADLEEAYYGPARVDWARIVWMSGRLSTAAGKLTDLLLTMCPARCMALEDYHKKIDFYVRLGLDLPQPDIGPPYTLTLDQAEGRADLAGGKAAGLARAKQTASRAGLATLPGLVVTANAYNFFVEANDLRPALNRWLRRVDLAKPESLREASWALADLVAKAHVPDAVADEINTALSGPELAGKPLVVRSSALGEDGPSSYAGQYQSELNVAPGDALAAYKRVLAGKYSERAITYRILAGQPDDLAPMAVLMQPMLDARTSGVVYTKDPGNGEADRLAVFAVPGQGFSLADGLVNAQVTRFGRNDPPTLLDAPEQEPLLAPGPAGELARAGLRLEAGAETPLDIEWAQDKNGALYLLQSRPLFLERRPSAQKPLQAHDAKPVMQGLEAASRGASCGRVFHVNSEADLARMPDGAVVVTRTLSPFLTAAIHKIAAAVAGSGSRASHFASVAREFGVPALVCRCNAFEHLADGVEVTVDARANTVYLGRVDALLDAAPSRPRPKEGETWQRMTKVMPHLAKLNLTDPHAQDFAPHGCRSLHDIVRYAHETAVREMFTLVGKGGRGLGAAKKLDSGLPLTMYVLDVGGGLTQGAHAKETVSPEDLAGTPMLALWRGLATEKAVWTHDMPHMDWEEFDRISAGVFAKDSKVLASYGVLSEDYLHLMLRFGYHFSVLDSVCGTEANANYVNFQFRGGGGSFSQRVMRLEMIGKVLSRFGFETQSKGDLLEASFQRGGLAETARRLTLLGALMAETRLMDMRLTQEAHIAEAVEQFLADHGGEDEAHVFKKEK